ncbi:MAG: threonine/serine exporter family protein [Clostridiales bacterium]|jgi:uncharacterized membrane protein YjjB (DUF3815 family)|nr:threonine/serine exporter family protein [Clostridiales bacterium]
MAVSVLMAFIATITFSVLFNVPRQELVFIGVAGALGWLAYLLIVDATGSPSIATFFASMLVTFVIRILTYARKMPIPVFLIGGLISLVPGAGIYNTMYALISEDLSGAAILGLDTLRLFGVMCIGIMLVLSLPHKLFRFAGAFNITPKGKPGEHA